MPPNIIISPFLPHNSSRLHPSIYLKNDKKYQAWISLAIICRVLQLLHLHVHISSFFPPPHTHTPAPLLISFIQGFQRTNICNDSAESQGGATRGASRRLPAREGMGGMGGAEEGRGGWGGGGWRGVEGGRRGGATGPTTVHFPLLDTPTLYTFLLFHSKKEKRQPFKKPFSGLITR